MTELIAFTLFDKAISVVGLIREGKKQRNEKVDEALSALYAALLKTKPYIAKLEGGGERNSDEEFAIAGLWDSASIPLRTIDVALAERCYLKGGYWMEPTAWDADRIKNTGISVKAMEEATRALLTR